MSISLELAKEIAVVISKSTIFGPEEIATMIVKYNSVDIIIDAAYLAEIFSAELEQEIEKIITIRRVRVM